MTNSMKKQNDNLFLILLATTTLLAGATAIFLSWGTSPTIKPDIQTQKLKSQGLSDEISALTKDVQETDLTNIDKELKEVEAALEQP
jgi:hypothetical protein